VLPLWREMLPACVAQCAEPGHQDAVRPQLVEEVSTLLTLRKAILELHTGFTLAELARRFREATLARQLQNSRATSTSPEHRNRRFSEAGDAARAVDGLQPARLLRSARGRRGRRAQQARPESAEEVAHANRHRQLRRRARARPLEVHGAAEGGVRAAKKLEAQQLKRQEHRARLQPRTEAIGGIRTQALEMFAVFDRRQGRAGIRLNLTTANAQLGRSSATSACRPRPSASGRARRGSSAATREQMAQSFTSVSDAFAGWKIGWFRRMIADLRAISTAGGKIIDVNKGVEQSFLDLSENLQKIHNSGPDGSRAGRRCSAGAWASTRRCSIC
jgi:hypothetical protein